VPNISVTVIAKNEAANIGAALASVSWADEIIVVDSESTDGTVAIARQFTDRVIVRPWPGYVGQKNYAATLTTHDWILSLDADERVTPALAEEIQRALRAARDVAYRIPRVTWHLGRWVRTTDWYPDYQVRLYDRRFAQWTGQHVHEALAVSGSVGDLRNELQHYPYRDISDHLETIDRYTTCAARQMREGGRRAGLLQLAGHPPLAFLRNYIARGGVRDGVPGFVISALNAYYVFLKFAKLWELGRSPGSGFQAPGSGFEVPGSGFSVPGSGVDVASQSQTPGVHVPGSAIEVPDGGGRKTVGSGSRRLPDDQPGAVKKDP
jgi:glycosyltransferase involved in cell wall biosynthesis